MIAHSEVKLREHFSSFELLKEFVDVGERILVLNRLLVQWPVVNTETLRAIFLLDK